MKTKVVIIGGGPAGLMAAYQLDKAQIDYVLIDKNPLLGKKLLITGGSRCNVTNNRNTKDFINDLTIKHKKFLYSSLNTFGSEQVISFMNEKQVPLVLENDLKYFPKSNKSIDILNALSSELNGKIILGTEVKSVSKNHGYITETNKNTFESDYLIIATGSKSFPKTGSTGDGLLFAKQLGHQTFDFYPAETNVYSKQIAKDKEFLQGISIIRSTVRIKGDKQSFIGGLLFTHNGISGPVIQHASEFIYFASLKRNVIVECSVTDSSEKEIIDIFDSDKNSDIFILKLVEKFTIKRLARYLLQSMKIQNKKLRELSKKDKQKLINSLLRFEVFIDRVEDKELAYVNGGGVNTKELSPKTFESKLHNGLFFIGETVDVHGPIGGYNITIALSSGYNAAKHIIECIKIN